MIQTGYSEPNKTISLIHPQIKLSKKTWQINQRTNEQTKTIITPKDNQHKMSSLQENNSTVPLDDVVNKRKAAFSRSDSFDKFHYTAFYALQLAGKHSAICIRNFSADFRWYKYCAPWAFVCVSAQTARNVYNNMCVRYVMGLSDGTRLVYTNIAFSRKFSPNGKQKQQNLNQKSPKANYAVWW